jgi:glycerate kinase
MPLRILIVPDKFKGTLTAQAAAELIAQGWREVRPEDSLELLPMSDGGDGFGDVLARLLKLQPQSVDTVDAAHRPHKGQWWWEPGKRTALIESAQVIGLALLPPKQFHPFELDTYGLGAVLQAACSFGAERCLMGIGGSATNDGGLGMALALGWAFLDGSGRQISRWTELGGLTHIVPPARRGGPAEVAVAVDVQNPLLGPKGASRVYGPQKGLRECDFALAEGCLGRLAEVVTRDLGIKADSTPGTGAAGGLGFGLHCFLNARLESGFALFARFARLEERIRSADLVITGEGGIDVSTLMGKGVGEVASLCLRYRIKCIGLAGTLSLNSDGKDQKTGFAALHGIVPHLTDPEEAMRNPAVWLPRLAATAARSLDKKAWGQAVPAPLRQ